MNGITKILLFFLFIVSVLLVDYNLTNASYAYESTPGNVDGVTVTALKTVSTYTRTWHATARSTANSSINWVGISYWTVEQMCLDLTYSYWNQKTNQGNSGTYYQDSDFISFDDYSCYPETFVLYNSSKGNHEFVGPYSTIYIYEEATIQNW